MFVLEKFCKTAFENKWEKPLFWWPEGDIPVVYCSISLSETVRGSLSLKLLEWKLGQVPLLSWGSWCLEEEWGKVDCALGGVCLGQGGSGHPDGLGQPRGRGRSPGDARVATGSAGETDLHQKLSSDFSVFKPKKFLSKWKGASGNALRGDMAKGKVECGSQQRPW